MGQSTGKREERAEVKAQCGGAGPAPHLHPLKTRSNRSGLWLLQKEEPMGAGGLVPWAPTCLDSDPGSAVSNSTASGSLPRLLSRGQQTVPVPAPEGCSEASGRCSVNVNSFYEFTDISVGHVEGSLALRFPDLQTHFYQPPLKTSSEKSAALSKPLRVTSASQCLASVPPAGTSGNLSGPDGHEALQRFLTELHTPLETGPSGVRGGLTPRGKGLRPWMTSMG